MVWDDTPNIRKVVHKATGKITEVGKNGVFLIQSSGANYIAYVHIDGDWMKNNPEWKDAYYGTHECHDGTWIGGITINPEYADVEWMDERND